MPYNNYEDRRDEIRIQDLPNSMEEISKVIKPVETINKYNPIKINYGWETNKNYKFDNSVRYIKPSKYPKEASYSKIDDPSVIIESSLDDRIVVNAGPGTGKTYTVIKRLIFLINNEIIELDRLEDILVLCYSRSAVKVIRERLEEEINKGNLNERARLIFDGIRTFDSFATIVLLGLYEDEVIKDFRAASYDGRIEKFVSYISYIREYLACSVSYLIVDEIQDIVGERASMLMSILDNINCGALLLGDKCQAIYDYLVAKDNGFDSKWLYAYIEKKYRKCGYFYELTNNHRQIGIYSEGVSIIRENILNYVRNDNRLLTCAKAIKEFRNEKNDPFCEIALKNSSYLSEKLGRENITAHTAIICRNNGEVSIFSSYLHELNIKHRIEKGSNSFALADWIEKVLSEINNVTTKEEFLEKTKSLGYNDGEEKWSLLKEVEDSDSDSYSMDELLDVKKVIKILGEKYRIFNKLESKSDGVTISTIHKSKGKEYDIVILVYDDFSLSNLRLDKEDLNEELEELKVCYVAFSRVVRFLGFIDLPPEYTSGGYNGKSEKFIKKIKRPTLDDRGRFYATRFSSRKSHKYPYCANFEVGLKNDIEPWGFIYRERASEIQKNIAKLKIGQELTLKLIDSRYYLYTNLDELVCVMSDSFSKDITRSMIESNPGYRYSKDIKLPSSLEGIYVSNIVTIVDNRENENGNIEYLKKGIWKGFEISGFSKTMWNGNR